MFAAARIGKSYVSYHFMPVYFGMGAAMSPALKKRMQGKACFNPSTRLFDELADKGYDEWRAKGWVDSDARAHRAPTIRATMIPTIAAIAERAQVVPDGKLDVVGVYNCRYACRGRSTWGSPWVPRESRSTTARNSASPCTSSMRTATKW